MNMENLYIYLVLLLLFKFSLYSSIYILLDLYLRI